MTLRELLAMGKGQRRFVGWVVGWLCASVNVSFNGKKGYIDPRKLMPFPDGDIPETTSKPKTEAERRYLNDRNFKILDKFFAGKH